MFQTEIRLTKSNIRYRFRVHSAIRDRNQSFLGHNTGCWSFLLVHTCPPLWPSPRAWILIEARIKRDPTKLRLLLISKGSFGYLYLVEEPKSFWEFLDFICIKRIILTRYSKLPVASLLPAFRFRDEIRSGRSLSVERVINFSGDEEKWNFDRKLYSSNDSNL